MHPRAFNRIYELSCEYRNPEWVSWLMRDYLNKNIAHLKATKLRVLFEKFVKADIAFKSVRDAAKNLCSDMRPGKSKDSAQAKIERTTMKAKLDDARRSQKITRNEMFASKSKLNKVVRFGTLVRKEYMKMVKFETENMWENEKKSLERKFEFNRKKVVTEPNEVLGVLVGDEELDALKETKNREKEEVIENVVIYGGVELTPGEIEILNHPPDHAIYPKLNLEMIETELDKAVVKDVWNENRENIEKEKKKQDEENDNIAKVVVKSKKVAMNVMKSNQLKIHKGSTCQESISQENVRIAQNVMKSNQLAMNVIKPHEWKNNKRVTIPENMDEEKEIRSNFVKSELLNVAKEYIEKHCDKKGNLKESNFDKAKVENLKELKKRVDDEALAVYSTDKTGKFAIDTMENVKVKMDKHIKNDKIITKNAIKKIENKLNRKTKHWIKMLNIGGDQPRRTVSNLVNKENAIPFISGTSKDHKKADDPTLGPDLRPIMGATHGPNTGLSQIGCTILKSVLENVEATHELKSTEEMLAKFDVYNKNLENSRTVPEKQKVIGSMDIKSFYPSIEPVRAAEICKVMFIESNIKVLDVNHDELAFYVAKEIEVEKIFESKVQDVVYTRKKKKYIKNVGKKMKMKVVRNKSIKSKIDPKAAWAKPKRNPNENEVKILLGLALESLIVACMENHIYQFNGHYRIQKRGGPTGLDLTGLVADVFMLWWDRQFVNILEKLKISLDIYGRFKDDCNILSDPLPKGAWFDSNNCELQYMNVSLKNEKIFEEKEIFQSQSDEENTMRILQEIANSIDSMIEFTVDHPSKHHDNKLPVLDLKVSVNTSNVVDFEFYEKPTKNPHVILASSALGKQQKRNIFVSEALRRLRNTSKRLGEDVQNKHLSDFMLKLKESGYDSKFRAEVIQSAKSAYSMQLENDRKGVKPLYREKHQIIADKKSKNQTKANWWKKKGGEKYKSVLFVPPTPGAKLAKLIQAREAQLNSDCENRIKVVEGKGAKLKDFLIRKNPFGTQECQKCYVHYVR